ncbi:MAG: hypothetical protein L3K11_08355 [Thermoplasmata archaeon]|nr:hypothetical protein [Thermoplasmata archaeon]
MRPGLVVLGSALALLGVLTVGVALDVGPPPGHTSDSTSQVTWTVNGGGRLQSPPFWGLNGSLRTSWQATVSVTVVLYGGSCPNTLPCDPSKLPVANWTNQTQGSWGTDAPPLYPYHLTISNPGHSSSTVSVTWHSSQVSPSGPIYSITQIVAGLSGAVLAAIGGVAIFLGLFLRRNVYGGRPPLTSQHADDAEGVADQQLPR